MPKIASLIILFVMQIAQAQILHSQVIYNSDERKEIFEETPIENMQFIQKRVLAMTTNAKLFYQPSGDILFVSNHYGRAFKLCEDERFYNQPSFPHCTASVIGKDLVLTAGHCISEESCRYMKFITDYVMDEKNNPIKTSSEKIYTCKKILYESEAFGADMAIIQVDREFPFQPLLLADTPIKPQDELLAVGFPSGLPMKSSGLGPIRNITDSIINAELETYGGNSGSPVFRKTSNLIEGLLVSGEADFILADNKQCYRSKVCDSKSCIGEDIISAQMINSVLKNLILKQ